jgi:Protein of unknown function (DUF4038)/Putative collagen-binding domain of a collagenase
MTRPFGHGAPAAGPRSLTTLALGGLAIGCSFVWLQAAGLAAPAQDPSNADGAVGSFANGVALAAEAGTMPVFPLAVEPGKRYLIDAAGEPFLIHGDTAWSLIAQLTREEAELYLDDRRARGFNAILVNLIEHAFATDAPANIYGEPPFLEPGDYSTPNEAYFGHADWVLRQAAERGILVLLTPSYLGWGGGSSGWYDAMAENGTAALRRYGQYLGRRYRNFTNILWVDGGDYDPPRKGLVRAIANGIRRYDSRALHTAHTAPETVAIEYWGSERWLQVNNVYTYGPVYGPALEQYRRPERMPFFLLESAYENEHGVTERSLRTQAYHAVLSGAAGQVFGNNPIWHFDAGGLYPAPVTWQQALDSRGAQSMTHLRSLLTAVPWWHLEPDIDNSLLTHGLGSEEDRAVAARSVDRSFAVLYLPSDRDIAVDLEQLAGPQVVAHWYDPANGRLSEVSGSPFQATGSRRFRPEPDTNSSGFDDWVLILESDA